MNIEQIIARRGNRKELSVLTREQERYSMELEAEKEVIGLMVRTEGWKHVRINLQKNVDAMTQSLKKLNPADIESIRTIQSDIRSMEKLMNYLDGFK